MYAVNLAALDRGRTTRSRPAFTKEFVNWGAGTRAVQYLVLGAKARAAIAGRVQRHVRRTSATWPALVLRHRVMTNFHAEAEGMTPDKVVRRLLDEVRPPRSEDYR